MQPTNNNSDKGLFDTNMSDIDSSHNEQFHVENINSNEQDKVHEQVEYEVDVDGADTSPTLTKTSSNKDKESVKGEVVAVDDNNDAAELNDVVETTDTDKVEISSEVVAEEEVEASEDDNSLLYTGIGLLSAGAAGLAYSS